MSSEIWVPLLDFVGLYDGSSCGRIRSYYVPNSHGPGKHAEVAKDPQFICNFSIRRTKNYKCFVVNLSKSGIQSTLRVAPLILGAFKGLAPKIGLDACHKNNDPFDNRVENLRWDTRLANMWDKPSKYTAQAIMKFYIGVFKEGLTVKEVCSIAEIDRHSCCGLLAIVRSGLLTQDEVLALRESSGTKRVESDVVTKP